MVEFLIGTYDRPWNLTTLLGSLIAQTDPNWKAHVICDGHFESINRIIDFFKPEQRIRFSTIDGPSGDWGNTPRMHALSQSKADWVIMTGDDNYYTPIIVEELAKITDESVNFIFWHTLMHAIYPTTQDFKYRGVLLPIPIPEWIDLGSYATKPEFAKQIVYNVKSRTGDGEFARDYVAKFCNQDGSSVLIEKIMYVHN